MTLAAAAVVAGSPAVLAQAAPSDTALEEVVVTARQRQERLIDVPVTEQAFTAADIKAAGIERPQDFLAQTPGVSFVKTAEAGDLQVSIRGINTGRDMEPNFAFVVDGVLQTNPYGLSQELANIQQIEVVKGPQGAVYGRNAVAGAIIIDTKKPGDTFTADGTIGFANHQSMKANVWLAGPLNDNVSAGLNAFYTKTDGFYNNSYLGCSGCVDFYKEYGFAPRFIIKAGENGTVDVKAKYSKIDSGAINFNAATALFFIGAPRSAPFYENVNDHQFVYLNDVIAANQQVNKDFSIKGDWKFDAGTLTAWAAYNDQTNFFLTDGASTGFGLYTNATIPGTATKYCAQDTANQVGGNLFYGAFSYAGGLLPPYDAARCGGYQYQQRDQKDASLEVRFTSPSDQPFRWLAGLYYGDIKRHVVVSQGADLGKGFLDQAFVPTSGPNPTDQLYDDDFHSKVSAVFGQIAYDIQPNLEGAIALRYDSEKRTVDNNVPKVNPQTPGFGPFGFSVCPATPCSYYINPYYNVNPAAASIPSRSDTFSEFEPKVTLNWKFVPNWAAFASWGVGFRSGGFNSSGSQATIQQAFGNLKYVTPAGVVTTTPSLSDVNDEYKKEVSKAAEIGIKGEILDRSLFLSADYYYTKVDNMQVFNFFAGTFGLLRVVTNIDEAKLSGFEASARWKASQYVTLFAGAATVDSKIDRYTGRPYTAGNKVPYAPEYTADAGVDLNFPLSPDTAIVARVDANTVGKTWFNAVQDNTVQNAFTAAFGGIVGNFATQYRDPYTLMNVRLGFKAANWDVTAYSTNVTNKHFLAEVIPAPEFGGSFIHEGVGRTIGVDFSYHFQAEKSSPAPVPAPLPAAPPPPPPPPPPPAPPVVAAPPPPPPPPVQELVLKGVNFETDSAKLLPSSTAILDGVVTTINSSHSPKVAVRGYTDSTGKAEHNKKLSERRAAAVKDYLEAHGVAPGVLTAEGFGEENPIASNKTAKGRAENRRVTVQYSAPAGR